MTIIPAIDLIDGKCVRLTKGDYAQQVVYSDDPLEMARMFEDKGVHRLHVVDLDGAKAGRLMNLPVLEKIAAGTSLSIDYGGGVKSIGDVSSILDAGASMVTIGSLAAKHPELLEERLMEFGTQRFMIGADVLDGKIRIHGWLEDAGINIFDFVGRLLGLGVTNIFCTDISRDGVLGGPSIELYQELMAAHPELQLIASGGVSTLDDVLELRRIGCAGAIIGKAIYEGRVTVEELVATQPVS